MRTQSVIETNEKELKYSPPRNHFSACENDMGISFHSQVLEYAALMPMFLMYVGIVVRFQNKGISTN